MTLEDLKIYLEEEACSNSIIYGYGLAYKRMYILEKLNDLGMEVMSVSDHFLCAVDKGKRKSVFNFKENIEYIYLNDIQEMDLDMYKKIIKIITVKEKYLSSLREMIFEEKFDKFVELSGVFGIEKEK